MIRFTIPIAAQAVQTGGKRMMIRGGKPVFFKDRRTASYTDSIMALAVNHRPTSPIEGPVSLELTLVLARPQTLMRRRDPEGLVPAPRRPDIDNLVKGILDPLTALSFWRDDGQITEARVRKMYAEKTGAPRIEVSIAEFQQEGVLL